MSKKMHLVEFTIENYKSVRDVASLSLIASKNHEGNSAFTEPALKNEKLLNSAVISGPNASGKSNVLRALFSYKKFIISSNDDIFKDIDAPEPFLLDETSRFKDTVLESTFIYKNRVITYGFSASTSNKAITKEWLKVKSEHTSKTVNIFTRDGQKLSVNKNIPKNEHGISRSDIGSVGKSQLLVSFIAKLDKWSLAHDIAEAWSSCSIINTVHHDPWAIVANAISSNEADKQAVIEFLQKADIPIVDIVVEKQEIENGEEIYKISLVHEYATKKGIKKVSFDLMQQESAGTQDLFRFALEVVYSLRRGSLMILDEIGSKLHPLLLEHITKMFSVSKNNRNNAQFILTTHDAHILDAGIFARDQTYLTAKVRSATDLYCLSDIRGLRPNMANKSSKYLRGDFGAIPTLLEE